MEKFKQIAILLEFEDGSVRQVVAPKLQKELAVQMCIGENGKVHVSEEIEPMIFKPLKNKTYEHRENSHAGTN